MSEKETGGPAFPCDQVLRTDANGNHFGAEINYPGMTMRDYFAANALQGLLADSNLQAGADEFAFRAYTLADAMLNARES